MANSPPAAAYGEVPQRAPAVDIAALVVAHHAAVYRYAWRLCGCPTNAEDLAQQTFLIAQQKLHQLREGERAGAWLLSIVRSCYFKSLRKPRPALAQDLELPIEEVAQKSAEVPEIDREQLAAALAELPEEFRLVVLMFYFEELPYHKIAEELGLPMGTVMSRLSRAKAYLRRRLTSAANHSVTLRSRGAQGRVSETASLLRARQPDE